MFIKVGNT